MSIRETGREDLEDPLLDPAKDRIVRDGSVDFHGSPALASQTGGARIATTPALLVFMLCSSLSIYGVSYNLVLFMVSKLGLSNAAAAAQASLWTGVHDLSPLLVAYISDARLGRFRTTVASALIYSLGIALLAIAAALVERRIAAASWLFFLALYVIAMGKGFVASLLAFGADQFDGRDRREAIWKSSYFNWYYFSSSAGLLVAVVGIVFVGDRFGFSVALFLCAAAVFFGIAVFVSGARIYRYGPGLSGNPYARLITRKGLQEANLGGILSIWLGSVVYEAMRAQTFSLFVEEADLMDTSVGSLRIPPASLNCFDPISVLLWTVVYDRALVPAMRRATGDRRGFSFFQRMGVGLLVMTAAMAAAALVESNRKRIGGGMSVLWQIPQFTLVGGSKVFYYVGLIEFLYDQAPEDLRTLGAAMAFFSASIGSFLSGFLVSVTARITGERGWIPKDLNDGHLDRFFWLLVALGVANWALFLGCSYRYKLKK